jgi:hypothetical protein
MTRGDGAGKIKEDGGTVGRRRRSRSVSSAIYAALVRILHACQLCRSASLMKDSPPSPHPVTEDTLHLLTPYTVYIHHHLQATSLHYRTTCTILAFPIGVYTTRVISVPASPVVYGLPKAFALLWAGPLH